MGACVCVWVVTWGRGGEVMGEVMGGGGEGGLACVWMLECAGARKRRMGDTKGLRRSVEEWGRGGI